MPRLDQERNQEFKRNRPSRSRPKVAAIPYPFPNDPDCELNEEQLDPLMTRALIVLSIIIGASVIALCVVW